MKTVFLHGLGQTAQDWKEVVQQLSISDVDCPELFSSTEDEISYSQILGDLEQRYSEVKEPLRICGLSLGALLAIDFAIRHEEKVDSLVLIGAQYKVPSLLIDFQNLIFRCMPVDCQHFFRQIFLGYFSDIVQAFDTLRKNVCGDDYTSLHNPIVLSSVLPAYGMFHSIQILFL